jgi:hypothetical protein
MLSRATIGPLAFNKLAFDGIFRVEKVRNREFAFHHVSFAWGEKEALIG